MNNIDVQERFSEIETSIKIQIDETWKKVDAMYKVLDGCTSVTTKRSLQHEIMKEVKHIDNLSSLNCLMFKLFKKETFDPIDKIVSEAAETYM